MVVVVVLIRLSCGEWVISSSGACEWRCATDADSHSRRLNQFYPNSCACNYDGYCCNNWDGFCQSCEDGFATQYGCPAGACGDGGSGPSCEEDGVDKPRAEVFTPGEYELNEGILLAYEGPNSWLNIVAQMAAAVR